MYKYAQEGNTDTVIRIADGRVIKMVHTDPLSKAVELWMSRGHKPFPADPVEVAEPIKESENDEKITEEPPKKNHRKWRDLQDKK